MYHVQENELGTVQIQVYFSYLDSEWWKHQRRQAVAFQHPPQNRVEEKPKDKVSLREQFTFHSIFCNKPS